MTDSPTYPVKTCLWFDTEAEPAARLYTSLVPGSEILSISHYLSLIHISEPTRPY